MGLDHETQDAAALARRGDNLVEAFAPASSPLLAGRFNALVANVCWNCRLKPPRARRQPFHTDADLCEACDEAAAGVDQLFEE